MDERQRLDEYLAWRQAQRKDRRRRLYRFARVAGTITALMLLATALAVAVAGWPRVAKRDVRLPVTPERATSAAPAPSLSTRETPLTATTPGVSSGARPSTPTPSAFASAPAEPRVTRRRSVPPAARRTPAETTSPSPSASMSSAAAEPETPRNAPPEVMVQPPPPASEREAPSSAPPRVVVVDPPPAPTVTVEPPTVVVERPARRAAAPVPAPAVATPQSAPPAAEERMDTLKRLAGYIPEVWLARTVARWVKTQPPGETAPGPPERQLPQAR